MSSAKTVTFLIITPTFNQENYIKETIESVLSQQGDFGIEYCVIDGKSTDHTVKILESYYSQLFWVSEKDNGQTDAINKGIRYFQKKFSAKDTADTQYVFAYLNSDDYYLPDALSHVAQHFAKNPQLQWLVGDAKIISEDGLEIQRPIRWYKKFWRYLFQPWVLLFLNPIPQPATFIRWSAIEKVGLFNDNLRYVMDYEYWLRIQKMVRAPSFTKQPLAAFRIHGNSKGGSQFLDQFAEEVAVAEQFSTNNLILAAHRFHNLLITSIYRMIK